MPAISVVLSPNKKFLVSYSETGFLSLYDVPQLNNKWNLFLNQKVEEVGRKILDLKFSQNKAIFFDFCLNRIEYDFSQKKYTSSSSYSSEFRSYILKSNVFFSKDYRFVCILEGGSNVLQINDRQSIFSVKTEAKGGRFLGNKIVLLLDDCVQVYDITDCKGKPQNTIKSSFTVLEVSNNEMTIVCGGKGKLVTFDSVSLREKIEYNCEKHEKNDAINVLKFSKNDEMLISFHQ